MITELIPATIVEPDAEADVRVLAVHALVNALVDARGDPPNLFRILADCVTTLMAPSRPVDDADRAAIETCIDYARLAAFSTSTLQAERAETRAERERTSRFQQEMLGIVGHDLRAPLGAILIGTEILSHDCTIDAKAVTQIVSFANRMSRIVDQVLDLTRLRLGGGATARSGLSF